MKIECEVQDMMALLIQFQDVVTQKVQAETEHAYTREKIHTSVEYNIIEVEIKNLIRGIASANKIQAIKSLRALLGLGLKEAKDMVEEQTAQGEADKSLRLHPATEVGWQGR